MKKICVFVLCLSIMFLCCKSYNKDQVINNNEAVGLVSNDTVSISSDETDYELIIIEPGFNAWLNGTAQPRGYYSQRFLEGRNAILVQNWNIRQSLPTEYDENLYQLRIDYDTRTDYGYEVNYKLYNYFVYFQIKYKQRIGPFVPRI